MGRYLPNSLKGQNTAAIGLIAVIAVVLIVLIAFPNVLSGFSLGGGGGDGATTGVGPGTAGVVINSFTATPSTIEGGDIATFTLHVQNKGGIDAKSVEYEIFGLDDSNAWSGKSEVFDGAGELDHADPSRNIPGEETTQEWEATAKEKNIDITYPVTARVDYDYRTESDTVLVLFGRDNPNVEDTGKVNSDIDSITTTDGPIGVSVQGRIPLVSRGTDDFNLNFQITNAGGGRPYTGSRDRGLDTVDVSAEGCDLGSGDNEIRLINGRRTIQCEVTPSIDEEGQETKSIHLEIDYSYIVEDTARVTVLRQPTQD